MFTLSETERLLVNRTVTMAADIDSLPYEEEQLKHFPLIVEVKRVCGTISQVEAI